MLFQRESRRRMQPAQNRDATAGLSEICDGRRSPGGAEHEKPWRNSEICGHGIDSGYNFAVAVNIGIGNAVSESRNAEPYHACM